MIKLYQYIIGGLLILLIILISSNIIQAQQLKYWKIQQDAKIGAIEKIGNIGNSYVYRMIDWQTGKVIYVTDNPFNSSVSACIAVSNLEHY